MADDVRKPEILVIASLLPSMDYYQVLKVDRKAPFPEIKKAFFRESQVYHPDRFYASTDEELKDAVLSIYKRVAESYAALRDPALREKYDAQIASGQGSIRLDRKDTGGGAGGTAVPAADPKAKNSQAQKYLQMGLMALRKGDFAAAELNLNFALKFEPGNDGISKKLKEAQDRAKAKSAADPKDPYKIV
jgi:DnaJ-class molecular chaperone